MTPAEQRRFRAFNFFMAGIVVCLVLRWFAIVLGFLAYCILAFWREA